MTNLINVRIENDRMITDSRNVADVFSKRHDNVIRDIENLKKDVLNTRIQKSDTTYELLDRRGKKVHNSQREFSDMAKKALSEKITTINEERQFILLTSENFNKNYDENL